MSKNRFVFTVNVGILAVAACLYSNAVRAEENKFFLSGGERIVFIGDSITQAGQYVDYVEAFFRTRLPEKTFTVINHGLSSETISGTSEPDHNPPRPFVHERFARDVTAWRPDVVISCYGMNDGNYYPPSDERLEKYQQGIRRLIARASDEAHARLVILTPPPYDPYRRKAGDPEAIDFGYKFPAVNYDQTLDQFSRWLLTLRNEGVRVVDLHGPINEHLRQRREKKVSFYLAGDAVHPNETGHWLMAQQLLLAWNAPAEVANAEVDVRNLTVLAGEVSQLSRQGAGIAFVWKSPLPLPLDARIDFQSLAIERVNERLNRYRLKVDGLSAANYELLADGQKIAELARDALSAGVDVANFSQLPTSLRSQEVLKRVTQRRQLIYRDWRMQIAAENRSPDPAVVAESQRLDDELRKLCQPMSMSIELKAAAPR